MENTDILLSVKGIQQQQRAVEQLTVITAKRSVVKYDFEKADRGFYKFPCYLRRAAINEAIGKVKSCLF